MITKKNVLHTKANICINVALSTASCYKHVSSVLSQLLEDLQNMQTKVMESEEHSCNIRSQNMCISSIVDMIDALNVRAPSPVHAKGSTK